MKNMPRLIQRDRHFIESVTIYPKQVNDPEKGLSDKYKRHRKVFDEQKSQRLPQHTIWDHAIKLLPNALKSLPGRLLSLTQEEITKVHKFVEEHLKKGTIRESWSPYTANFFFVKKKDGKL